MKKTWIEPQITEISIEDGYVKFNSDEMLFSFVKTKTRPALFLDVIGCLMLNGSQYNVELAQSVGQWLKTTSYHGAGDIRVFVWSSSGGQAKDAAEWLSTRLNIEIQYCEKSHTNMRILRPDDIMVDDEDLMIQLGKAFGITSMKPAEFIEHVSLNSNNSGLGKIIE